MTHAGQAASLHHRHCGSRVPEGAQCGEVRIGPGVSDATGLVGLAAHSFINAESTVLSTIDLDTWFDDDELGECPVCRAQKLLPVSEDLVSVLFCLTCGLVVPSCPGTLDPHR